MEFMKNLSYSIWLGTQNKLNILLDHGFHISIILEKRSDQLVINSWVNRLISL